jgi:hypothetical protein
VNGVTVPNGTAGTIASLTVPDGTYMVWAQLTFQEFLPKADPSVSCTVSEPYTNIETTVVLANDPNTGNAEGEASLVGAITLSGGTNEVDLVCSSSDSETSAHAGHLALLAVDALN